MNHNLCVCLLLASCVSASEQWITQVVDHYNFRQSASFQQRLIVDNSSFVSGGPIFFYTGNEADIMLFVNNTYLPFGLAAALRGLVVFAEHRYYGKSLPFGANSFDVDKIGFLSIEQAMADYAVIIDELKTNNSGSAVITIGGSYGANLALWMRTKYPHLVDGAVASSATPRKSLLSASNAFYQIVTDVFGNVSSQCPVLVRKGFATLAALAESAAGRLVIQNSLRLCDAPSSASAVSRIYDWVVNALSALTQFGYPYAADFYNPLPAFPYKVACEAMLVAANNPLAALWHATDVYYNSSGQGGSCFSNQFSGAKPRENRTTAAGTAWAYQTCTELYHPMPTNGVTDMFLPSVVNDTANFMQCRDTWQVTPRPAWEELVYGGGNIAASSNILLIVGQLDPWRSAAITAVNGTTAIQVFEIEGGAHHLDLRAPNPADPPSCVAARELELALVEQWIAAAKMKIK